MNLTDDPLAVNLYFYRDANLDLKKIAANPFALMEKQQAACEMIGAAKIVYHDYDIWAKFNTEADMIMFKLRYS